VHDYISSQITFEGVIIEIRYCQVWTAMVHDDGSRFSIAQLEVQSIDPPKHPLPITETGYKSHFIQHHEVMEYGGATEYTLFWINKSLEDNKKRKKWEDDKASSNQLSLF
jgi:hypothetical protein